MSSPTERYIGIELGGARSQRTSLVVFEYYSAKKKLFLLDVFDHIKDEESKSADRCLLEILHEFDGNPLIVGLGVPLSLPPCFPCGSTSCPTAEHCSHPDVAWMRTQPLPFQPYTHRATDLYWQRQLQGHVQIHEVLNANEAPLAARALYLKNHIPHEALYEVRAKLSLFRLLKLINLPAETLSRTRDIEHGFETRAKILLALSHVTGIFVYQRDMEKIARHLSNFDAFLIALTAFLAHHKLCEQAPENFPRTQWIQVPQNSIAFEHVIQS